MISEYTPLQKVISEENLLLFAANLAFTEQESYVQSASLKCMSYATRIESIWKKLVHSYPHINVRPLNYIYCTS